MPPSTLRSSIFRDRPLSALAVAMGVSLGGVSFCFLTDDGDCSSTHAAHNDTCSTRKGNGSLADDGRMKQHFRWQMHHHFRNTSCLCEAMKENRYQVESRQLFPPKATLHAGVTNASKKNNGNTSKSTDLMSNRILFMADMLSPKECQLLRNDADNLLDDQYNRDLMDDVGQEDDNDNDDDADDD